MLGVLSVLLGMLADLIGANRKLLEATLVHIRRIEDQMDGANGLPPPPGHYAGAVGPKRHTAGD